MSFNAYIADLIFTGEDWLEDHAVIVNNGLIEDIVTTSSLPDNISRKEFSGCTLTPALIDLQIYGAYGKLLSVYPEADSLSRLHEYCLQGGAAFCLPTAATNTYPVFHKCIDAVKDYWAKDGKGILGLHLEGPWINPLKRGAHIESMIHSPSIEQVAAILKYGEGVIKMITLAPEVCSAEVIELILSKGVIVSAGHSNATYQQAKAGYKAGITTTTHLYNAMSALQHRAPGLVGAVMTDKNAMSSIIPDGHHVDFAAIEIAKAIMKERLFVITDAVTDTTEGPYQHQLVGDKYESGGILSGSALTMGKAVNNLVQYAGVELGEAIRMCSLYPARVIRMDDQLGKIKKGYRSVLSVFTKKMETVTVVYE